MEKVLPISLELNFIPHTFVGYGLRIKLKREKYMISLPYAANWPLICPKIVLSGAWAVVSDGLAEVYPRRSLSSQE